MKGVTVAIRWDPALLARLRAFADARSLTVSAAVKMIVAERMAGK